MKNTKKNHVWCLCRDDFNRQNLKLTINQNLCCLSLWQTSSSALTGLKDGKPCHLDMDVNVSVCRHNRLQQLIAARFRQTCMFFCTYWLFLNTRESSLFLKQSFSLSLSLFFPNEKLPALPSGSEFIHFSRAEEEVVHVCFLATTGGEGGSFM